MEGIVGILRTPERGGLGEEIYKIFGKLGARLRKRSV